MMELIKQETGFGNLKKMYPQEADKEAPRPWTYFGSFQLLFLLNILLNIQ